MLTWLAIAWLTSPAEAVCCPLIVPPPPFETHEDPTDTVAPFAPLLSAIELYRGWNPCGTAHVALWLEQPGFDPHRRGPLGYRVRHVGGMRPEGLAIPRHAFGGEQAVFTWTDLPARPMELVVEVVAVDRAGNESAPLRVTITDAGAVYVPPDPRLFAWALPPLATGAFAVFAVGFAPIRPAPRRARRGRRPQDGPEDAPA